ncbi:MAG TPA: hypothetical protein VFS40_07415 [Gemmatimonadales bacterium]|nr:hypothetical protein [Gemmatimonadales bacterium]
MSGNAMSGIPVFVNDRAVTVPAGAAARAAVRASDPALAERFEAGLAEGRAQLTDGRGIALDPAAPLAAGAIVRVVISARRGGAAGAAAATPEAEGADAEG